MCVHACVCMCVCVCVCEREKEREREREVLYVCGTVVHNLHASIRVCTCITPF